ncbi:hypothetical protein VSPL_01720 [Vibrio splendidus]|nr:hypothetical protein VSPL_01720 [Vibrio splendidus]
MGILFDEQKSPAISWAKKKKGKAESVIRQHFSYRMFLVSQF